MKLNPNLAIIIFALIIAFGMFALGAFLNGERVHRKNDRQRIKEIERKQEEINYKIDSVYAKAIDQEREIIERVEKSYEILEDISNKKESVQKSYNNIQTVIEDQKTAIENIKRNLGRDFILKPKKNKDNE